jgi:hypothetical protein
MVLGATEERSEDDHVKQLVETVQLKKLRPADREIFPGSADLLLLLWRRRGQGRGGRFNSSVPAQSQHKSI